MKIDKMLESDLPSIVSLVEQLGYPTSLEDLKTRFQNIKKYSQAELFVAKDLDVVCGYIQVNTEPLTLLDVPRAQVSALIVNEKVRRHGIGAALLAQAETWAKENGLAVVRVRSNTKRDNAHPFYEKEGYSLKKTSHLFVKNLD